MKLPEFGVKRPVTNLMIFCAILVLAFYSLSRLGIDLYPEIEPPVVSVITAYPGASPGDVEIKVTEVLENQLATTPALEKITSTSAEGISFINLKFIWGTDLDAASNDIRDRIELAKRLLPDIPDEMDNPYIFKFNSANIPILFMGVTAKESYTQLYDMIDQRLGDALRQLPGVGTVQIQGGGLKRQINIWVDRQRLEGYGFSILEINNVIAKENITQPVGNLKTGMTDYLIRLPGEFKNPEEINNVILGMRSGKAVYLKDVARVEDGFQETVNVVRFNKEPALMMMVQKQSGTNTVEVTERVKQKLAQMQKVLPADVKISIVFDTSKDIISSINTLTSSLWQAIVLVILVVWFFLRQASPSMIIALSIPFSLLISFIYIFLAGKTINAISLSSLAIASGMVVDNAIVVVDNIHRKMESGQRIKEAAIFGAQEMFLPIVASTLTTVVVFVPMLFIPGVVGIMFGELAIIVIVTLAASLFTASTFTPMLCSKWMAKIDKAKKGWVQGWYNAWERIFCSWEEAYSKSLAWALKHKKIVILGFTAIFISSLFLTSFVGNEFIPNEDTGDVRLTVNLPIGTRFEESEKVASKIEDMIKSDVPEARLYFARCGQIPGQARAYGNTSGSHVIVAGAKLVSKTQRKRSDTQIANSLRSKIENIPGVMKIDITTGNPIGRLITGTGGKSIQVEILGNSFEDTDALAAKIKLIMEKINGAVDVSISREANRPELRLTIDREKASFLGLNMYTITQTLNTYLQGYTASRYREKGETYDIYVRLEESSRSKIEDIENLFVVSSSGEKIRFSNFATVQETTSPQEIERKNRQRLVRVECNAFGRSSGKIVEDVKTALRDVVLPQDVMLNIGGEAEEQAKAFRDMGILLALGIILVYMVMAAQFESLLQPFIIMFAIPFTFTGVIWGFLLTGVTLSLISYLGIIMLMGIVVNNAIVLISYINILRARGHGILEAVTMSGKSRLRPVLMTTITTLVGLLPLALSRGEGSETWQPLGVTMIGGLTVSTLITLLFVPTLYAVFEVRRIKKEVPNG
ncbi:MAG: efflux RND transporter permease subunit [Candidatus Omnitrophica bacterium]|jgi:HAE1 family hydrophobic/amphiphilic exporter-1|nr:efflux RND transporter permease subunit [Candidatus Omnitrophota bacterium]